MLRLRLLGLNMLPLERARPLEVGERGEDIWCAKIWSPMLPPGLVSAALVSIREAKAPGLLVCDLRSPRGLLRGDVMAPRGGEGGSSGETEISSGSKPRSS